MKFRFSLAGLILAALWLTGCGAPTARVQQALPSPAPRFQGSGLALGGFSGPAGRALEEAVTEAAQSRPEVELYLHDPSGAAALVTGQTQVRIEDREGRDLVKAEEDTGRSEEVEYKDPFVHRQYDITRPVTRTVTREEPFILRRAEMVLEYTLTGPGVQPSPATSELSVVQETKYGGINDFSESTPGLKDLPSENETMAALAREMARRLLDDLFPLPQDFEVRLDQGLGWLGEDRIREGVDLARAGQWDQAVDMWNGVLKENPEHPSAAYNIGVANERLGSKAGLEKAREMYGLALKHGNRPEYRQALTRVVVTLEKLKKSRQ